MLYEIFERGDWVGYRESLERTWRPYVNGRRTLSEAAADLIEAVKAQSGKAAPGGMAGS